jgi:predicted nucleotidyltransferase
VKAVKGVNFAYQATRQTRELLSTFRDMVNDAIRICLEEDIKGRLKLRDRVYKELQERYGIVSTLPYSVAIFGSVARGLERETGDIDLLIVADDRDLANERATAATVAALSVFGHACPP